MMKIRFDSFKEWEAYIRQRQCRIVLFGAGVIGQITAAELLREHGLLAYVDCYIDNDGEKWGQEVSIGQKTIPICSPEHLTLCNTNTAIVLNISRFAGIIRQLEQIENTREMDCFIMPAMCVEHFCSGSSKGIPAMTTSPLIPKKIHYMWLGGKEMPDNLRRCIESWHKYCPDYEIVEWNEGNYDVSKHRYMKDAYDRGAYGFVPDYARLDLLYQYGGIYMDTDVELKKCLDPLLYQEAFCGVEKWQTINFGGCSGAVKGHPMIKALLDARQEIGFLDDSGRENRNTCGYYDTRVVLEHGYRVDGTTQTIEGMNIYAYDYFHPYDYMSGRVNCTEHTYSIHWFNGGWLDKTTKRANEEIIKNYEQWVG